MPSNRSLRPHLERQYDKSLPDILLEGYAEHGSYKALAAALNCHYLVVGQWIKALGLTEQIEQMRVQAANKGTSWQRRVEGKGGNRNFQAAIEAEIGAPLTDALLDAFEQFETRRQVAAYFQVSENTIANWTAAFGLSEQVRQIKQGK